METQSISTNLFDNFRRLKLVQSELVAQIASGNRLVFSRVDPSGGAMSRMIEAQLRGASASVENAQDALNLVRTADSALAEATEKVNRIRELAVRMANSATANTRSSGDPNIIYTSDQRKMYAEMGSLAEEIRRSLGGMSIPTPPFIVPRGAASYNNKDLFFADFDTGQEVQIGADNNLVDRTTLIIPSMTDIADSVPTPSTPLPGTFTSSDFRAFALILLDEMDIDLEKLSNVRADLGVHAAMLEHTISDLSTQLISLTGTNSRITDTNIADAIHNLKKNMLVQSTFTTAVSQLNTLRESVLTFFEVLPSV